VSLVVSLVAHAGALALLSWVAFVSLSKRDAELRAARGREIEVGTLELPLVGEGMISSDEKPDPRGEPPRPSGGVTTARVDDGRKGHGGEVQGARATNLADHDEKLSFAVANPSHLGVDQVPRIDASRSRRSLEDRRSSREPMELTFLSQGQLARLERRAPSPADPSRGARADVALANVVGGHLGSSTLGDELRGDVGASREGGRTASPGRGVADGREGQDHRAAAAVAHARPDVAEQKPSVQASERGRPTDDVDADQNVSTLVRSLVHASAQGGRGGEGQGGSAGPGEPGAGGTRGQGSTSAPLGLGDGGPVDFNTRDPRLFPYFRQIHAKVDPLWAQAFPKSALYDLKQGTVILEFTVSADGSVVVAWPPARPSGIDEFDRNCADAIRRAAPFGPIPKELGVSRLRIRAPFEAKNPIVK
jgi:TonB family protein